MVLILICIPYDYRWVSCGRKSTFQILGCASFYSVGVHRFEPRGAPARESRTGTWLVSPPASGEKKKWTPAEQGLATSILVH